MDDLHPFEDYGDLTGAKNEKDTVVQLILSAAIGLGAFLTFCVRHTGLEARRFANDLQRFLDQDGLDYMQHARSTKVKLRLFQSYQALSLVGYRCYGGYRSSKSLLLQALMHSWYVSSFRASLVVR